MSQMLDDPACAREEAQRIRNICVHVWAISGGDHNPSVVEIYREMKILRNNPGDFEAFLRAKREEPLFRSPIKTKWRLWAIYRAIKWAWGLG